METNEEYMQGTVALLADQRDNLLYVTGETEKEATRATQKYADAEVKAFIKAKKATLKVLADSAASQAVRKKAAVAALLRSPHALTFMMRVVRARTVLANHRLWNITELYNHLHGTSGAVSLI